MMVLVSRIVRLNLNNRQKDGVAPRSWHTSAIWLSLTDIGGKELACSCLMLQNRYSNASNLESSKAILCLRDAVLATEAQSSLTVHLPSLKPNLPEFAFHLHCNHCACADLLCRALAICYRHQITCNNSLLCLVITHVSSISGPTPRE